MRNIFFSLFIFLSTCSLAQNIDYAHYIVNTLSSETFKGRGFVDKGDKIAARFIKKQLDSLGIDNKFQYFPITVNTYPKKLFLSIDKKELIPGKDFLIDMHSGSINGSFSIKTIKLSSLPENLNTTKKTFILLINDIFDKKVVAKLYKKIYAKNIFNAAGYIFIEDNLINEPAVSSVNYVIVKIKKKVINLPATTIKIKAKNKLLKNYRTQNIWGLIQGKTDTLIVFSAHYDHLGKMGKRATFYGANDNASGVAMVLDLANYFSQHKPYYSMAFIFFSGEEEGLLGSFYFVEHPIINLQKIKFLFNLDMVGTGQDGIQIVNSTVFHREMALLETINNENHYLQKIKKRGPAANSDHYPFYNKGVPSFFIYTLGGSRQYHNIFDKADQLSLFAFENMEKMLIDFVKAYK